MLDKLERYGEWCPLILRVALGLILIVHGYDKLFVTGVSNVAQFFSSVSIPLPIVSAWIASIVEFVGGSFILLGIFTRWSSLFVVVQFAVILFLKLFKWKAPFFGANAYELDLLIFAVALVLLIRGPGMRLALGKLIKKKQ